MLRRAGIGTVAAELLLVRMRTKVDGMCSERDALNGAERSSGNHKRIDSK
jgi:hypothetical protein